MIKVVTIFLKGKKKVVIIFVLILTRHMWVCTSIFLFLRMGAKRRREEKEENINEHMKK